MIRNAECVTSVQDDVVDHAGLVFAVVKTEGASKVFEKLLRSTAVTAFHMQRERRPDTHTHTGIF